MPVGLTGPLICMRMTTHRADPGELLCCKQGLVFIQPVDIWKGELLRATTCVDNEFNAYLVPWARKLLYLRLVGCRGSYNESRFPASYEQGKGGEPAIISPS
jgi:hypothetical protein